MLQQFPVKGGVKVQRLAGRNETVTLPGNFWENVWFFTANLHEKPQYLVQKFYVNLVSKIAEKWVVYESVIVFSQLCFGGFCLNLSVVFKTIKS